MKTEELLDNKWMFFHVEAALKENRHVRIRLVGWSMYPFLLNKRDVLVLAACSPDDLEPMDVVLAKVGTEYILHRLIRQVGDRWVMQGDANVGTEELVSKNNVIGRLIQVKRDGKEMTDCRTGLWRWNSRCWVSLRFCRNKLLYIYRMRDRFMRKSGL